jgi:hypothetical protein
MAHLRSSHRTFASAFALLYLSFGSFNCSRYSECCLGSEWYLLKPRFSCKLLEKCLEPDRGLLSAPDLDELARCRAGDACADCDQSLLGCCISFGFGLNMFADSVLVGSLLDAGCTCSESHWSADLLENSSCLPVARSLGVDCEDFNGSWCCRSCLWYAVMFAALQEAVCWLRCFESHQCQ